MNKDIPSSFPSQQDTFNSGIQKGRVIKRSASSTPEKEPQKTVLHPCSSTTSKPEEHGEDNAKDEPVGCSQSKSRGQPSYQQKNAITHETTDEPTADPTDDPSKQTMEQSTSYSLARVNKCLFIEESC